MIVYSLRSRLLHWTLMYVIVVVLQFCQLGDIFFSSKIGGGGGGIVLAGIIDAQVKVMNPWQISKNLYQQNVQNCKNAKKSTCENMSIGI